MRTTYREKNISNDKFSYHLLIGIRKWSHCTFSCFQYFLKKPNITVKACWTKQHGGTLWVVHPFRASKSLYRRGSLPKVKVKMHIMKNIMHGFKFFCSKLSFECQFFSINFLKYPRRRYLAGLCGCFMPGIDINPVFHDGSYSLYSTWFSELETYCYNGSHTFPVGAAL